MKRRMCYFLMVTLQIIMWYSVKSSRPFASHDVVPQPDQVPQYTQAAFDLKQGLKSVKGVVYGNVDKYRALSRLGSRPPSCEHKCEGCIPCDAIQIPEATDHMELQYANYEPEGWKCKCGSAFFNP